MLITFLSEDALTRYEDQGVQMGPISIAGLFNKEIQTIIFRASDRFIDASVDYDKAFEMMVRS